MVDGRLRITAVTLNNNAHFAVFGLIAGFIGSKLVNKTGEGIFLDIILGIVGAVVGGWVFQTFGSAGVTGLNVYSLIVAVIGSVIVLLLYHLIRRAA
jgi:uncharacterized membrane protein YeaQ/YmgE (transglycosylase-associated protein family)